MASAQGERPVRHFPARTDAESFDLEIEFFGGCYELFLVINGINFRGHIERPDAFGAGQTGFEPAQPLFERRVDIRSCDKGQVVIVALACTREDGVGDEGEHQRLSSPTPQGALQGRSR